MAPTRFSRHTLRALIRAAGLNDEAYVLTTDLRELAAEAVEAGHVSCETLLEILGEDAAAEVHSQLSASSEESNPSFEELCADAARLLRSDVQPAPPKPPMLPMESIEIASPGPLRGLLAAEL